MVGKTCEIVFKKSALQRATGIARSISAKNHGRNPTAFFKSSYGIVKYIKVQGADSVYRVRIQDYRLIFSLEKRMTKILVIKIGHRWEVYD